MDIKQAKQELRQTVLAYTAKTADGCYRMPRQQQRPIQQHRGNGIDPKPEHHRQNRL